MILQKIILPFDAGTADTIYTKQGETGRGIWFDFPFDIPADELENFKCEFIAVKPDDTFVIEDAGLSTHGEGEGDDIVYHTIAQLTLPEQVSAAKGTGSYILKVYDYVHDNDLIYSAAGGLYVDDHLLLDSMIESIAEVNGYNFPDDFLTRADLLELIDDSIITENATWSSHKIDEEITEAAAALQEDIDGLIDDNNTSADTTWSSQKISDEIGNIDVTHAYTTDEQLVGTWIDGKPLYERTLFVENPTKNGPLSGYYYYSVDGISGIDFAFTTSKCVYDSTDSRWYGLPYFRFLTNENIYDRSTVVNNQFNYVVNFYTSQAYNLTKIVVTYRYTKV